MPSIPCENVSSVPTEGLVVNPSGLYHYVSGHGGCEPL